MAKVKVEIEVGVLDPVGVVEVERNGHQSTSKRGEQREAFLKYLTNTFESPPLRGGRGIDNYNAADMALLDGRLHVQEAGINASQLLHGRDFTCRMMGRRLRSSRLATFTLTAVTLAALTHTFLNVLGPLFNAAAALTLAAFVGPATTPAPVFFWSFSHLPVPHSDGFRLARSVGVGR
jgi:hypothetical protein